ncbi:helix-turn-helix transcriptional regulator [uncultured Maribacter sp.]|uniref:helix-turn-helix domain-containing protein n=1 Tax=uncultured Maribacter sp. TaxID=431308 RepID=UPI00262392E6|nr:helix-turn-helix transcriptional regulator [uncultured Maribacter sp.]
MTNITNIEDSRALLRIISWEKELRKETLFRNILRLASVACVLTLLMEAFVPLGNTYLFTMLVLVTCLIGLVIHSYEKHQIAYHFFTLSLTIGFFIFCLLIEKVYPSFLNLYSLGIFFTIAFISSSGYIILIYLLYFTMIQLFLSHHFLSPFFTDYLLYEWIYDAIHIIAYNMGMYFIAMYFIKFSRLQKDEIDILETENDFSINREKVDFLKLSKFETLSPREQEIALLIGEGLTNQEIGERLFISAETVKTHRKNIKSRLSIKTNKEFFHFTLFHK